MNLLSACGEEVLECKQEGDIPIGMALVDHDVPCGHQVLRLATRFPDQLLETMMRKLCLGYSFHVLALLKTAVLGVV